jgi:hypothetical protein
MSVKIKSDDLSVSLDASKLALAAAEAIASAHQERIRQGMRGDGSGAQEKPKRGDRNNIRGFDTGMFANSIRPVSGRSGSKDKASVSVAPQGLGAERSAWLEREAKRGITYVYAGKPGTPLAEEVNEAMARELDKMIK